MKPRIRTALGLALALLLLAAPTLAQSSLQTKRTPEQYNLPKKTKLALQGYDPVAYFTEGGGKAKKGKAALSHTHGGVTYRFTSEKTRELFKKNPAKYEPAYGGWCAFAMADGKKVSINPKSFKVTNGRLFLFYTSLLTNTRKSWVKKEGSLLPKADANWKKLTGEAPRKASQTAKEAGR